MKRMPGFRRQEGDPLYPISEETLGAFADGELPPRRARRVAAAIRRRPHLADLVHEYWRREAALTRAFETEIGPLSGNVESVRANPKRRPWLLAGTAGALGLVILAAVMALAPPTKAPTKPGPLTLTQSILRAYNAQATQRTVAANGPSPVQGLGLQFVGHQQVRIRDRQLNVFHYRNAQGVTMALYQTGRLDSAGDGWLHLFAGGTVPVAVWSQAAHSYVLVGDDSGQALVSLALRMRHQLARDGTTLPGAAPASSGATPAAASDKPSEPNPPTTWQPSHPVSDM